MESPFRAPIPADTRLIETLLWTPEGGFARLDLHFRRLEQSAAALGFPLDRAACLQALTLSAETPQRVRLTVDTQGSLDVIHVDLPPSAEMWHLRVHETRLKAADPWLGVKTTNRRFYDEARADLPFGIDEWLFLNERDEVCEGTITNVFVVTEEGERLTPALTSGLLPGVLRASLLREGWKEAVLTLNDLAKAREIYMGNALRGLIKAELAPFA